MEKDDIFEDVLVGIVCKKVMNQPRVKIGRIGLIKPQKSNRKNVRKRIVLKTNATFLSIV